MYHAGMPPSRRSRLDDLDAALVLLRRLWKLPVVSAFLGARLDRTIEFGHYRTLNAIESSVSHLSVGEVATVLRVDASTGSRLVERMVACGYVERLGDDADRRRSTLRLTPSGQSALNSLQQVRVDALTHITHDWKASEIADLGRLLHKLDQAARNLGLVEDLKQSASAGSAKPHP